MAMIMVKAKGQKERGMALLLALFALLLLSAIGLFMVMASDTETRIDANYGSNLRSYYAARSGLEEIRDRIKYPSASGGLADLLPQTFPGSANSVLYVLNPAGGETVDPTDPNSPYFDDQLCHDYDSGVAKDIKCTILPGTPNWSLRPQSSAAASTQLGYKWIRINLKTNRIADPYFVDQTGTSAPLDTVVCWDGQSEQLSPGGANPSCDANGMQSVYMLTSLAVTSQAGSASGSRKLLRFEVAAPSIRPPGTVTMGASGTLPVLVSTGGGIPSLAIDGRPRKLDGVTLATSSSCSSVAPLGTDTATGSAQLEQALNLVRKNIVDSANASCKMDGTGLNGNICSPGAWWVRGTDTDPRFITSNSGTSNSGSTGTSGTSGSSGSDDRRGRDGDDDGHDGHDHHNDPSGVADSSGACDPTNPSCFTNLDLAAPELFATSAVTGTHIPVVTLPVDGIAPFTGGRGNQSDASIYQPGSTRIVNNAISAVNELVHTSIDQPNYFTVSSAALAPTYGSSTNPAVVVITDSTLSLQNTSVGLTGYGVLVIPQALEISNAPFHWTGIVVVQSPTGHVTINSGATGSINGALLLQPGAALNLQNDSGGFRLTYSCEAIDLPFASSPFRIISTAETSF
jgi:hypothetical protein